MLCTSSFEIEGSDLGSEIPCPDCGAALRVNPFVVSSSQASTRLIMQETQKLQSGRTGEDEAPGQADELRSKGEKFSASGDFEQAIDCYDHALKLRPDDLALLGLRMTALFKLGRTQEALDTIDIVLDKELATGRNLGNMYGAKGHALAGMGKHEEALNCYWMSLDIVTDVSKVWYMQGYVLGELGQYETALVSLKRAQKIEVNEDTHLLIGYCYMQLDENSKAEQEFRSMLELGSSNPYAYHGLGLVLILLAEIDEGCQWLLRFIDSAEEEHAHLVPQVQQILDGLS